MLDLKPLSFTTLSNFDYLYKKENFIINFSLNDKINEILSTKTILNNIPENIKQNLINIILSKLNLNNDNIIEIKLLNYLKYKPDKKYIEYYKKILNYDYNIIKFVYDYDYDCLTNKNKIIISANKNIDDYLVLMSYLYDQLQEQYKIDIIKSEYTLKILPKIKSVK